MTEFMECAECSAKPGSPTLCPACLHNRTTIGELAGQVQALEEEREESRQAYEFLRERRGKDYGWPILFLMIIFVILFSLFVLFVAGR